MNFWTKKMKILIIYSPLCHSKHLHTWKAKGDVQQNVRAALFRVLNMNADRMQSISKNDKSHVNKLWSTFHLLKSI